MTYYWTAQGTLSSLLGQNMKEDNIRKGMYIYVYVGLYIYVLCCTAEIGTTL